MTRDELMMVVLHANLAALRLVITNQHVVIRQTMHPMGKSAGGQMIEGQMMMLNQIDKTLATVAEAMMRDEGRPVIQMKEPAQ